VNNRCISGCAATGLVVGEHAAVPDAQQMEERLRTRDLLRSSESFVEFYDQHLPRQCRAPRLWSTSADT